MANRAGEKVEAVTGFISLGSKITETITAVTKLKDACSLEGKPRKYIKKQRHQFADKCPNNQSYDFSSSHAWIWELDHEEG